MDLLTHVADVVRKSSRPHMVHADGATSQVKQSLSIHPTNAKFVEEYLPLHYSAWLYDHLTRLGAGDVNHADFGD